MDHGRLLSGSPAFWFSSGGGRGIFPDHDGQGVMILRAYRDLWKLHVRSTLPALPAMLYVYLSFSNFNVQVEGLKIRLKGRF